MKRDINKVFLTLKLEFDTLEDALLAKERLGGYFKNIQLRIEKQLIERKLKRHNIILETLQRHNKPIMIGKLHSLVSKKMTVTYRHFSRDVSELLLQGKISGERRKGYGGNTTIVWVKKNEGIAYQY